MRKSTMSGLLVSCLTFVALAFPQCPNLAHSSTTKEKYALLVGIDNYGGKLPALSGCVNDVNDMRSVLCDSFDFTNDPEHVLVLVNAQATRDAIISAFKRQLIDNARKHPDGIFVFEFSGHGSQVKDTNGDEEDGWDETIVPIDSRTPGHFDIIDDELAALLQQLEAYTANSTIILDCCHSGTGSRGNLKVRGVTPDRRRQPPQSKDRPDKGDLRYVTISACMAAETAGETSDLRHPNGLMTRALLQSLNTAPSGSTFRDLGHQLEAMVNSLSQQQHPQIEGAIDRQLFSDSSFRATPHIRIVRVTPAAVTVNAGIAQGVRAGGLIALYQPTAKDLTGNDQLIAELKVLNAREFESDLEPLTGKDGSMLLRAKARIVTPYFATQLRLHVDRALPFANELVLLAKTTNLFVSSATEPEAAKSSGGNWDVAVVTGSFQKFFKLRNTLAAPGDLPGPTQGYFVTTPSGEPVFNLFIPKSDKSAPTKLVDALCKHAKQQNLLALTNSTSKLDSMVNVRIGRIDKKTLNVKDVASRSVNIGDRIRLQVDNLGQHSLFVSLLGIDTNGSIGILYPPPGLREPVTPGHSISTRPIQVVEPSGLETVKLVVTTNPVDFSFLTQDAVFQRSTKQPLAKTDVENLFSQAVGLSQQRSVGLFAHSKSIEPIDSWAASNVNIMVRPAEPF